MRVVGDPGVNISGSAHWPFTVCNRILVLYIPGTRSTSIYLPVQLFIQNDDK